MRDSRDLMRRAWNAGIVIPAFNIPYLPMMAAIVRALKDTDCFGLIAVARPEWEKFEAGSPRAVYQQYEKVKDEGFTRLHLDHVPVIDEDLQDVDFGSIIATALDLGFGSVMVDGSRLDLEANIEAVRKVVEMAHAKYIPVEAELGAVLGHEEGPLPPYEELFASGKGFTDIDEALQFAEETDVDWLSVAIGNIHGAISEADRDKEKVAARLNIDHLAKINRKVQRPLVLHGGSGIQREALRRAFGKGIAKINIGTSVRQAYEQGVKDSSEKGLSRVYDKVVWLITEELDIAGSAEKLDPLGD